VIRAAAAASVHGWDRLVATNSVLLLLLPNLLSPKVKKSTVHRTLLFLQKEKINIIRQK
jgi:hypothetical protein